MGIHRSERCGKYHFTFKSILYCFLSDEEVLYNLSAVLIHRGPSAYSGHYIAHIQDPSNDFWFRVNDEETEKMKAKKLQLENDDEWTGIIVAKTKCSQLEI